MAARTWGRKGRPYRRAQALCFAEETACYLCGEPVDQTMPNYRHRKARSVHHLIPPDIAPELANDRANMRLAHIGCNSKYGRGQYQGPRTTTRPWHRGRTYRGVRTVAVGVGGAGGTVTNPERDW